MIRYWHRCAREAFAMSVITPATTSPARRTVLPARTQELRKAGFNDSSTIVPIITFRRIQIRSSVGDGSCFEGASRSND